DKSSKLQERKTAVSGLAFSKQKAKAHLLAYQSLTTIFILTSRMVHFILCTMHITPCPLYRVPCTW
ncbi:MAG: hypothetical protein LBL13_12285, partial [Bacteroidales bacterium]|nr:hypothetical protein [Bacteroidales bacterium]